VKLQLEQLNLKRLLPLGIAIGMGTLSIVFMQGYLAQQRHVLENERKKLRAEYPEPVDVIVALRDVPESATLTQKDLGFAKIPQKFVQPYATARPADVLGMVTKVPLATGEQVLRNKLRRPEEAPPSLGPIPGTLSGLTPEGKRAITIGTDALSGVNGFIRPGDTVDILWTVKLPEAQGGETVTLMLLQSIGVLAVGDQMLGSQAGTREPSRDYTITLALTPEDASLLLYAREQGRVQLSLRSRADKGQQVQLPITSGKTLIDSVLGKNVARNPAQKPQHQVEVIKGLERSVVAVND